MHISIFVQSVFMESYTWSLSLDRCNWNHYSSTFVWLLKSRITVSRRGWSCAIPQALEHNLTGRRFAHKPWTVRESCEADDRETIYIASDYSWHLFMGLISTGMLGTAPGCSCRSQTSMKSKRAARRHKMKNQCGGFWLSLIGLSWCFWKANEDF